MRNKNSIIGAVMLFVFLGALYGVAGYFTGFYLALEVFGIATFLTLWVAVALFMLERGGK